VAVATLKSPEGAPLTEDTHYFVGQLPNQQLPDVGLTASAVALDETIDLRVSATSFAQSVSIDVPGYVADDSYFHLSPGQERRVRLQRRLASAKPRGHVQALNGHVMKQIRFEPNGPLNGAAASK
jgi:beta-mannosidase